MGQDRQPVVVAFDGSAESDAAVRAAARLFPGRVVVVVTVWEPGLAMAMTGSAPDHLSGLAYVAPSPETMAMVDEAPNERATDTASAGAGGPRRAGAPGAA